MPVRINRSDGTTDTYEAGARVYFDPEQADRALYGPSLICGRGHELVHEWDVCWALHCQQTHDRAREEVRRALGVATGTLEGDESEGVRRDRDKLARRRY